MNSDRRDRIEPESKSAGLEAAAMLPTLHAFERRYSDVGVPRDGFDQRRAPVSEGRIGRSGANRYGGGDTSIVEAGPSRPELVIDSPY